MTFKHSILLVTISIVSIPVFSGCATGPYAQSATLGGGLAGGAIGALIGSRDNRSLEGAAIGAVTGGVIGNATGNLADRDVTWASQQNAALIQQARNQAVTPDQVIQMTQNGVSEQLIINQLQNNGVLSALTTNDMISMKQYGVSDNIISAWQQTPIAGNFTRLGRVQPIVVQPVYDDFQYIPTRQHPCDIPYRY